MVTPRNARRGSHSAKFQEECGKAPLALMGSCAGAQLGAKLSLGLLMLLAACLTVPGVLVPEGSLAWGVFTACTQVNFP